MYKSMTGLREQKGEKEHLLNMITEIVCIVMERGITLKRLLEKDPNNPKLHRLRIIHIIEADYNPATKILWSRRLMKKAENYSYCYLTQTGDPGKDVALKTRSQ